MLESFKDLNFSKEDTVETVEAKLKEMLGISFEMMGQALSVAVQNKAEEIVLEITNIAPYGEYDKMLENNDDMASFLKEEAHKPENWLIHSLMPSDVNKDLIEFIFDNKAVDDGDTFRGYVYVNKMGKIKHAFAQSES